MISFNSNKRVQSKFILLIPMKHRIHLRSLATTVLHLQLEGYCKWSNHSSLILIDHNFHFSVVMPDPYNSL